MDDFTPLAVPVDAPAPAAKAAAAEPPAQPTAPPVENEPDGFLLRGYDEEPGEFFQPRLRGGAA